MIKRLTIAFAISASSIVVLMLLIGFVCWLFDVSDRNIGPVGGIVTLMYYLITWILYEVMSEDKP